MKFILIVLLSAKAGSGLNMWDQPAMTTATFDDRPACEAAAAAMKSWERDRRLEYVVIRTQCVPAASEEKKQ